MRFLLLLFISGLYSSLFSQQIFIQGKVYDALTGAPVENVKIELLQRKTINLANDEKSIRPFSESVFIKLTYTNNTGDFSLTIPENISGQYFAILVTKPGYLNTGYAIYSPLQKEELLFNLVKEKVSDFEMEKLQQMDDSVIEHKNSIKGEDVIIPEEGRVEEVFKGNSICSYPVSDSIYVKNLFNGYNLFSCPSVQGSFTGYLPTNEFIAGVVGGEMGLGSSFPVEAKKTQAVCARTYALKRVQAGAGGNCGHAYSNQWLGCSSCSTAAFSTNKEVVLYNNSLITAYYAARCNGILTQNSAEGTFNPSANCNLSGVSLPYLPCRPCSGHPGCDSIGETPCCYATNSCYAPGGYIYGHGVGMCQRGSQQFALNGLTHCDIIQNYYTNVCIANSTCDSQIVCSAPSNNSCSGATPLTVNSSCSYTYATTCGATSSQISSCVGVKDDDVWFKFNTGNSSQVSIQINPTYSFNPAFQVLTSPCGGSMSALACVNNTGAGSIETDSLLLSPNTEYFIRIWHVDSGYGVSGNFSICLSNVLTTDYATTLQTENNIRVIPNPNRGEFYLEGIPAHVKIEELVVYNIYFQEVMRTSQIDYAHNKIKLAGTSQGLHYIRFVSQQGSFYIPFVVN